MKAANGSTPIDASKLGEMGVATSADAIAGIFGTLIGGFCVDRVRRWHWVLCFYLIWQGLAFMSWTIVDNCETVTLSRLVVLSVSLTWKASLLQTRSSSWPQCSGGSPRRCLPSRLRRR